MEDSNYKNSPESNPVNSPTGQSTTAPKNKKNVLLVLVTLLISAVVFGLVGFYLGYRMAALDSNLDKKNEYQREIEPTTPNLTKTANSQTLSDLTSLLENYNFQSIDQNSMWWVSDDNWSIFVDESESIGLINAKAYSELQNPASETSKIVETVSLYFINQGYSQNQNNSSQNADDQTFYDFIRGFEDNNEKCLLTVNPDESYYQNEDKELVGVPNIVIACSSLSSFDASYNEQLPFLKAMNDREAIVHNIQEKTETEAIANVHWRRTGAFALFSKKSGSWEMIFRGQDAPSCQLLEEYNFPEEIAGSCFDDSSD